MNQDQLINLIQTIFKMVGAAAVAKGIGDSSTWESVTGAVVAVASWYWSHRSNASDGKDGSNGKTGIVPLPPPVSKLPLLLAGALLVLATNGCAYLTAHTRTPVFASAGSTNVVGYATTDLRVWTFWDATNNLTKARVSNGGPTNSYTPGTSVAGLTESSSASNVVAIIQAAAQAAASGVK